MKRQAQPRLTADDQQTLDQYEQVLRQLEDLSSITVRNYLSNSCPFISWCEAYWNEKREERSFTPQAVAPALLIRYRDYLPTSLGLKPSSVNRTLMNLKRYCAWARKAHLIQADPASPIKFVPKEATSPRHLSDDEEEALVATVNATGTLRDQTIIVLLLHTGLRAQELCSWTRQQLHLSTRNGTLRITGKRKKVREVPLNATARLALNHYLERYAHGMRNEILN